jgi:hypothetical protein
MRDGVYLAAKRLAKKMSNSNYSIHQCQNLNSRIGWSKHCDSFHFYHNNIKPYVNVKVTRRIISNVDKISKQRKITA